MTSEVQSTHDWWINIGLNMFSKKKKMNRAFSDRRG